eukprot:353460-Chlamydomonas_euryale.AAC.7
MSRAVSPLHAPSRVRLLCMHPQFGLADCHPGLAMSFIELSGVHYPERLGQVTWRRAVRGKRSGEM